MKSGRISRVIQLLTALQSGQSYGVSDLVEMLKISKRMLFRDMSELRMAGLSCDFDNKARCYRIDPHFFLSVSNLNIHEALGLLLLARKARNYIPFQFRKSAVSMAIKIENSLSAGVRQYCNTALKCVTIEPCAQEIDSSLDWKFVQLLEAILKKRFVNICYYYLAERKEITTDLQPYHLMYADFRWYVFGESSFLGGTYPFKLSCIKSMNTLDKYFVEEKDFDVYKYLGQAWLMIPEGRLYHVRLRFAREIARNVADVQWHSTQTVIFQEDGSAIIEFRVDGLNEITWWVLSYGDQVKVLAPAALQQKVMDIAQNMVKQNV